MIVRLNKTELNKISIQTGLSIEECKIKYGRWFRLALENDQYLIKDIPYRYPLSQEDLRMFDIMKHPIEMIAEFRSEKTKNDFKMRCAPNKRIVDELERKNLKRFVVYVSDPGDVTYIPDALNLEVTNSVIFPLELERQFRVHSISINMFDELKDILNAISQNILERELDKLVKKQKLENIETQVHIKDFIVTKENMNEFFEDIKNRLK